MGDLRRGLLFGLKLRQDVATDQACQQQYHTTNEQKKWPVNEANMVDESDDQISGQHDEANSEEGV